jgi:hypothetical protein
MKKPDDLRRQARAKHIMENSKRGGVSIHTAADSNADNNDESDSSMVKRFLRQRRHAFKSLEVVWVQGGHHVHLDTPEPVAEAITEFLQRVRPPKVERPKL